MTKYCKTCRILDPRQNVCQLTRLEVDPDTDFCSKHAEDLDFCEKCGAGVLKLFIVLDGDKWRFLCERCASQLNSCSFCKNIKNCAFETDPNPIPKMVQRQIRQGPMTTVTTIKNPERVRQTCQNGCPCYDLEHECMRQFNWCKEMNHEYADPVRTDAGESEASADSTELHSEVHE